MTSTNHLSASTSSLPLPHRPIAKDLREERSVVRGNERTDTARRALHGLDKKFAGRVGDSQHEDARTPLRRSGLADRAVEDAFVHCKHVPAKLSSLCDPYVIRGLDRKMIIVNLDPKTHVPQRPRNRDRARRSIHKKDRVVLYAASLSSRSQRTASSITLIEHRYSAASTSIESPAQ